MDAFDSRETRLFLCGDLMTGRGIDQILPHPGNPDLHEPWVRDAREYVLLAERRNGPIERPVGFDYLWGEALKELERFDPACRIANLETSITTSDNYWPGKGIHYRMQPDNVTVLSAAGLDACTLANNHVLDWGYDGLEETLACLARAGIATAGAGADIRQAQAPVKLSAGAERQVLLSAVGLDNSGIPQAWRATNDKAGVWRELERNPDWVASFADRLRSLRRQGDILICSIHWGGNWGYDLGTWRRQLAHRLIDEAGVDIVQGHSSHHPLGIEVYRGRLILYGCGDLLNDYEGISGHWEYRPDLSLLYLVRFDGDVGQLRGLELVPMRIRRMRLERAGDDDSRWLQQQLDRECRPLGSQVEFDSEGSLQLRWG